MLAMSIHPSVLTWNAQGSSLLPMTGAAPTILGMSLSEFAIRAKQAGEQAVRANLQAGISVSGLINGQMQTIYPDDKQAITLIAQSRNVESE